MRHSASQSSDNVALSLVGTFLQFSMQYVCTIMGPGDDADQPGQLGWPVACREPWTTRRKKRAVPLPQIIPNGEYGSFYARSLVSWSS